MDDRTARSRLAAGGHGTDHADRAASRRREAGSLGPAVRRVPASGRHRHPPTARRAARAEPAHRVHGRRGDGVRPRRRPPDADARRAPGPPLPSGRDLGEGAVSEVHVLGRRRHRDRRAQHTRRALAGRGIRLPDRCRSRRGHDRRVGRPTERRRDGDEPGVLERARREAATHGRRRRGWPRGGGHGSLQQRLRRRRLSIRRRLRRGRPPGPDRPLHAHRAVAPRLRGGSSADTSDEARESLVACLAGRRTIDRARCRVVG
jgi:hypothetical protein